MPVDRYRVSLSYRIHCFQLPIEIAEASDGKEIAKDLFGTETQVNPSYAT
jgi:hypothetical protein